MTVGGDSLGNRLFKKLQPVDPHDVQYGQIIDVIPDFSGSGLIISGAIHIRPFQNIFDCFQDIFFIINCQNMFAFDIRSLLPSR